MISVFAMWAFQNHEYQFMQIGPKLISFAYLIIDIYLLQSYVLSAL